MTPFLPFAMPIALLLQGAPSQAAPTAAPFRPASISVEVKGGEGGAVPAALGERVGDAVERKLLDADFTALPRPGPSVYLAAVTVTRSSRGPVTAEGPAEPLTAVPSVVGPQVVVPIPSGKKQLHGLMITEVAVSIRRRSDAAELWAGRAMTAQVEGSPGDAPATLAAKLTNALFARFPEPNEGPVSVP